VVEHDLSVNKFTHEANSIDLVSKH